MRKERNATQRNANRWLASSFLESRVGRLVGRVGILGILTASSGSAVLGTTLYMYTGNTAGADGRRLKQTLKAVSLPTTPPSFRAVPCVAQATTVPWTVGGRSYGIARSRDYSSASPVMFASDRSDAAESACGAAAGEYCVGASWVTVESASPVVPTRSWQANPVVGTPIVVDAAGWGTSSPQWAIADKSTVAQRWRVGGTSYTDAELAASQASQLYPVSNTLFVGTDAGSTGCSGSATAKVRLLERSSGSIVERDSEGGTGDFKPEGVFVYESTVTCGGSSYDAVAYVSDFCGSSGSDGRIYVYGVDESTKTLTQTDVETLPSGCKPSTLGRHEGSGDLFVLCQVGDSILRYGLTNPCTIGALEDSAVLTYAADVSDQPSCVNTPALSSCSPQNGGVDCQPHDLAWSRDTTTSWMFVTMDQMAQVIVVRTDDLSEQYGYWGAAGASWGKPIEAEIGGVE